MEDAVPREVGDERDRLSAAPAVAEAAITLARSCAVDTEVVRLAARWKVASVVMGGPALPADATWRDLIVRAATDEGREEAQEAWGSTDEQPHMSAERLGGYVEHVLRVLTGCPDEPHTRHGLLSDAETEKVIDFCSGPEKPLPGRRFHELFEDRVRRHPEAVAAVQGGRSWTYREVNEKANAVAWTLRREGVRPEDVVAVVTQRSLEWLAAVIAVFKAGGCYLPLEPHFPAERMANTLTRGECRWVLADHDVAPLEQALAGQDTRCLYVRDLLEEGGPRHNLDLVIAGDQLAYIYFTSGSTGEPKGAMCEHDGFLNHLYAKIEDLGVQEGDVVAQTAPQCFDISLWQLVSALLMGGQTLIIEQDVIMDVHTFIDTLAENGVHVAQLVPTYLELFLSALAEEHRKLPDLRVMAVTGEALKKELVRRWFDAFPTVPLVNCYGLTEVSDDSNHGVMHALPAHRAVPLGAPVRNSRVYVMDDRLQLLPVGAPGEIVIAGVCVGRGYVNDPERTAAVFGRDPHRPLERLYRSGDFGRWLPSGELEYLGRRDSQVKISGFRIEIGEVEDRLLQVPGVRDGAVVVAGSATEPQLVGYYTGADAPDAGQVARTLARTLPEYMVPPRLYHTPELPLSGNGKIDKISLTDLAQRERHGTGHVRATEFATETERKIADLWAQVLKVPLERIGRDSRFTELGGTSLSVIRLSIALDRQVTVAELWGTPTVTDIAALVDRKAAEASDTESRPVPRVLAAQPDEGPAAWAADHRTAVRAAVAESGAVLLRGIGVRTAADVAAVAEGLGITAMTEREGFAPRTAHAPGLYSSSHWPSDEPMCMHHELSYAATVPGILVFGCLTAPDRGGRTNVADSQQVLKALPPDLVAPFERHGWLLTRMYHEVGMAWPEAFGTDDRAEVDAYCAAAGIDHEWLPGDRLRTRQRRAAVVRHPTTGVPGWFNQIAFLNGLTMDPAVREYLTDVYGPHGLPFHTMVGDGTAIDGDTVEAVNAVYDRFTVGEPWRSGDVLVVDNLRMAHSREPFEGQREIVVVMGDAVRNPGHIQPGTDAGTGGEQA
ncbi:amino acid adenylation domain-containing protein [Streptomyces sp. NPDC059455]|uniref:non-ribosomal peptide synthetase n=1 Tax=Streptomyces sp. NPDC059455 TaxID=3346837 RepID=UPI0036AEF496